MWRERESRDYRTSMAWIRRPTEEKEGERKGEKKKRVKNRKKEKKKKETKKEGKKKKLTKKTPPADGTRGIRKLSALVQNQGQPSHFVLYLTDIRTNTHSSGTEGCEILK
jgi:hypothetical protein